MGSFLNSWKHDSYSPLQQTSRHQFTHDLGQNPLMTPSTNHLHQNTPMTHMRMDFPLSIKPFRKLVCKTT